MRISDWSSDVCSSDLVEGLQARGDQRADAAEADDADGLLEQLGAGEGAALPLPLRERRVGRGDAAGKAQDVADREFGSGDDVRGGCVDRSEEHTSELQSLMRTSYAVFCLKKKTIQYEVLSKS